ncbi:MAG: hypothetical protein QNJ00_14835 [Woeseiaceae bacterium]|nr:hypothetical protein [Woeseiaceae bacterium]
MGRFPAGNLRLWTGQPVNAPFVTPPVSLRIFLVLCILSIAGTLFYGVITQLEMGGRIDPVRDVVVALVYFVLPVLVAHSIAVNRWISRPLIVLYVAALAWRALGWLTMLPDGQRNAGYLIVGLSVVVLLSWLFLATKMRVYYALISGKAPPDHLERPIDEILAPSHAEVWFTRIAKAIAPYVERGIIVLVFVSIVLAVISMNVDFTPD